MASDVGFFASWWLRVCVCWASLTPCPLDFRSMPTQQQTTIVKLLLIGDSGELSRPAVCFQSATPVVVCMVVLLPAHRFRNATHLRARVRRAPPASASSLLLTPRPSVLSLCGRRQPSARAACCSDSRTTSSRRRSSPRSGRSRRARRSRRLARFLAAPWPRSRRPRRARRCVTGRVLTRACRARVCVGPTVVPAARALSLRGSPVHRDFGPRFGARSVAHATVPTPPPRLGRTLARRRRTAAPAAPRGGCVWLVCFQLTRQHRLQDQDHHARQRQESEAADLGHGGPGAV